MKKSNSVKVQKGGKNIFLKETFIMQGGSIIRSPADYALPEPSTGPTGTILDTRVTSTSSSVPVASA
jgi:hypothetical protein